MHPQPVQLWVYIPLIIYTDIISVAQYILVVEKESGIIFFGRAMIRYHLQRLTMRRFYLFICSIPTTSKWSILQKKSLHCHLSKHLVLVLFSILGSINIFLTGKRLSWCSNKEVEIPFHCAICFQIDILSIIWILVILSWQIPAASHWEVAPTCILLGRLWSIWLWHLGHIQIWLYGENHDFLKGFIRPWCFASCYIHPVYTANLIIKPNDSHLWMTIHLTCFLKQMAYDAKYLSVPEIKWLGAFPLDCDNYCIPQQCLLPLTEEGGILSSMLLIPFSIFLLF